MENHHSEAYTNTSPTSKSELQQLNELSSSPHVDEQTKPKQPEMTMSENGAKKSLFASVQDFGYAASPESSQIERELEHSTWNEADAFFYVDYDDAMDQEPDYFDQGVYEYLTRDEVLSPRPLRVHNKMNTYHNPEAVGPHSQVADRTHEGANFGRDGGTADSVAVPNVGKSTADQQAAAFPSHTTDIDTTD